MAKVSYTNLKLKIDNSVSTFDFNGNSIEVLNYLPVKEKNDLIECTLQAAQEEGGYNPILLDQFFNLYLIYSYTNISFTDKQKDDPNKLYDALKSSGFVDAFLTVLSNDEYNELFDNLSELAEIKVNYINSLSSVFVSAIKDLPEQTEKINDIMKNFNSNDYSNILELAKSANGGNPIM